MGDEDEAPDHAETERAMPEDVRLLYQHVCSSHDGISDFRARLLALLPLATGTGVFLLLDGRLGPLHDGDDRSALGPVGLLGFAVALGLFVYELRGVQMCKMLRIRAANLERKLRVSPHLGQFRDREPAALGGLLGAEFAGWIVYGAVLSSWLYVAGVGFDWWRQLSSWVLVVGYLVLLGGVAAALTRNAS